MGRELRATLMVRHSNVVIVLTVALLCASLVTSRPQQSRDGNPGAKQAPREVKEAFDTGLKLSSEGKFEAATGEYRRALVLDPEQPYVLANLADALAKIGENNDALAAYEKAARLKPGDAVLITN